MRKISISVILIVVIGLFCAPFTAEAVDDSLENEILKFLQTDKGKNEVADSIERAFLNEPCIYNGVNGDLEISQPFKIPLYNAPTESIYDMESERYSICYCNDKAVGIVGFIPEANSFITIYYMLPDDFSYSDFSLCFYDCLYGKDGDVLYGSGIRRTVIATDSNKSEVVYYDKGFLYGDDSQMQSVIEDKYFQTEYSELKEYNCIDEKLPIICTVNTDGKSRVLPETFSCKIISAGNGMALTYSDGKCSMENNSPNNPDSQIFIIKKVGDKYSISPKSDSRKRIFVDKSSKVSLNFSYRGKLICKISGKDGSVLKVKNNKPTYGNYDFWDTGCAWELSEIA